MALQNYRDLDVWQRAMDLVEEVYKITKGFPNDERFGLTSQIQRAAVSIAANIAEGYGRRYRKEYLHHLSIARGSLLEAETHLIIAVRLKYIDRNRAQKSWKLLDDVGKMLTKLRASLS